SLSVLPLAPRGEWGLYLNSWSCFRALLIKAEWPKRVDCSPSCIVRKSAAVGGEPLFANHPMDDEVAPLWPPTGEAVATPNDLLWYQTRSTLSAHKAGNEVMRPSIPAFAATDPDIYERFMGRWSARMAGRS